MPRQTLVLGRLFEIRIGVHVSWLAIYALLTLAIAHGLRRLTAVEALPCGALCALALFASVVAHELAHALVARRFGVRTGAITLFLFGGVATLDDEPPTPRAEALIALAGPAMSLLVASSAFAFVVAVQRVVPGHAGRTVAFLGAYVTIANAILAGFNLLPAFPMDGGRVLRALVWGRRGDRSAATRLAARLGIVFALLLVVAGVLAGTALRNALYGWYVVLGAFLFRQSWSHVRAARRDRRADVEVVPAA